MIEQTEMMVTEWQYHPPAGDIAATAAITHSIELQVMKKRTATKKGIACRFSCQFVIEEDTVLAYTGEDSYVIDLPDSIDRNELLNMLLNSYSKFKEKFELRKLGTVLWNQSLQPLDPNGIDLDPILPLLVT